MLSAKQIEIFKFPYTDYDALICDGAVRTGKTIMMSLSFVMWAMSSFDRQAFGICGKSVGSVERNIVTPLLNVKYLRQHFDIRYNRGAHCLIVSRGKRENLFYLFGGKDESSYALIQGITLAGVLLDEVALMPRSFVEQATIRCSVEGAKLWFNCNPGSPQHWFRQEWLLDLKKHNAMHLHFVLDDNPSLSDATKERYRNAYSGVFAKRYIDGLWVMSEGLIYDMFDQTENVYNDGDQPVAMKARSTRYITCDYGTTNPMRFLEVYDDGEKVRIEREYSWDSRIELRQKTDKEYADDLMTFMGNEWCAVLVDPSAASFIAELRSRGVYVIPADNDVLDGIRKTASLFKTRRILVNSNCRCLMDELGTYSWDETAAKRGDEKPIKANDHSCDALRYYVNSLPDWRFE